MGEAAAVSLPPGTGAARDVTGGGLPLYCVPHAGAGTSAFARWPALLGPGIRPVPVLLPGRDRRRREARVTTRAALFADLLRTHGPPPPGPYALYGHSLGGLVAYSAARALRAAGHPGPALVVIGACPPPDATVPLTESATLPDDELLAVLQEFGAVPPDAPAGGIWRRTALAVLRDDLRLARSLRDAADGPLDVPLLTVAGDADPLAGPGVMAGWRRWAAGGHTARTLPGDHFFVRGTALPRLLSRACRVVLRRTVVRDSR
ncbi:thioesterase domain-containing protein [Streptomyces sp. TRM 70351]|uniref:thioesterase II family protein n=1 Tax=Streptomyces sp. TRM 70351 TaxID=3116552 RepID=UPI002E7B6A8C|nr:thioesterase domain-containing protein [Streptomyces sp. TRM 70351]MEE1929404.1 thioesterase domain-containing protein [Streptomyces sp. TRM 70351]